ncbi:hypothetical protein GOP47_0004564 [Adiantum capillus-veneris]|uniref:DUF6817 domain-containing protein n=1 Tax=Adiantum capillus-veneris TaxID=13818 RepID=A0A9D4V8X4_ADICA|nr:hypothetical protein GOP47_0004564 [Adiantum capillus-veneris]
MAPRADDAEGEVSVGTRASDSEREAWLQRAKPFLTGALHEVDPLLPALVEVLRNTGAAECWHKHGTFLEHLQDVYRILKLWDSPNHVARCGLFHSAYSNSYVNLAIFQPDVDRQRVRDLVSSEAEHLIHLFCIVPRHALIHDMLLFQFTDDELLAGLTQQDPKCLRKLRNILSPEGITVKHIRTGEDVQLPRSVVAAFLYLTMADFIDQLTGWQDTLFGNESGTLSWSGNNWTALWPGDGKPGLWMSAISRMGVLLNIILREEEIGIKVPPVFNNCTAILDPEDQIRARDLYWEAVHFKSKGTELLGRVESLLKQACAANPWVGEPHVLLAQVCLSRDEFETAEEEASKGLCLLLQWGTNWDKRVSWEGWVAWARVLHSKAQEKVWCHSAWDILNLGLVK